MERARALLNRLMGINRDKIYYEDVDTIIQREDICVYALASFCPFQILYNTKISLGNCGYSNHEDYLISYCKSTKNIEKYNKELFYFINELLYFIEQKIIKNIEKLENVPIENKKHNYKNEEKLIILERKYNQMIINMENLGKQGHIKQSYNFIPSVENLKIEIERLKEKENNKNEANAIVCEICSLTIFNNDEYLIKHNQGKLHQIIIKIRNQLFDFIENKKLDDLLSDKETQEIKKRRRMNRLNIHKI